MLQKIDSILQELCLLPSLSGHEQLVSNRMRECFQSYGLKVETDVLGNTITCIKGGDHTRRVMVSAHMDSPGLMVKTIDEDGFIHFERVGGIPEKTLVALRVAVESKGGYIPGVIGVKSHHLTSAEEKYKVDRYQDLYIDIGCHNRKQVLDLGVKIGNAITYQPSYVHMANSVVSATSLDNRIGCSLLVLLAEWFSKNPPEHDLYLVSTVQEEYTIRGAVVASRMIAPDIIFCLDAEMATDTPDLTGAGEVTMENGPVMSMYNFHGRGTLNGAMPHPSLVRLMEKISQEAGIPLQRVAGIGGLTELAYMQTEGKGCAGIDIGVPFRYSHSCIETVSLADIEKTYELLKQALSKIGPDFDYLSR